MPVLDRIKAQPQDHSAASYYSAKQNDLLGDRRSFTRTLSTGAGAGRRSADAGRGDAG
jgi:hypothetical protein